MYNYFAVSNKCNVLLFCTYNVMETLHEYIAANRSILQAETKQTYSG